MRFSHRLNQMRKRILACTMERKYAFNVVFYAREIFVQISAAFPVSPLRAIRTTLPKAALRMLNLMHPIDYSVDSRFFFFGDGSPVPVRSVLSYQIAHKKIHELALPIAASGAMSAARNEQ